MKKTLQIIFISLLALVLLLIALFFAGNAYFSNRFYPRTELAGRDVSGLTLSEASAEVSEQLSQADFRVKEKGEELLKFPYASFAQAKDISAFVQKAKEDQNQFYWVKNIFSATSYEDLTAAQVQVNTEKLKETLDEQKLKNEDRTPSQNARIDYNDEQGYFIQEAVQGNQVDVEKLAQLAQTSLEANLEDAYIQPTIQADDEALTQTVDEINQIVATKITLVLEDEEVLIPEEKIQSWIQLKDNKIHLNKDAIYDYLGDVNIDYATYAKERKLESTYSGTVTVQPKNLGWHIDREKESEQIAKDLMAKKDVKREANIEGNNYGIGLGFGPNYIEVDIAHQKLMIYKDHEKVFETDVITGRPGSETPVGASYVWHKETNTVLKGYDIHKKEDYETTVSYWVAITDDNLIGLHDASWQYNFGGDSRFSHGSLGCVNIPPSLMPQVYNYAELEMPVAVF